LPHNQKPVGRSTPLFSPPQASDGVNFLPDPQLDFWGNGRQERERERGRVVVDEEEVTRGERDLNLR